LQDVLHESHPLPPEPPGEMIAPHSTESEQSVLGSILLEQETLITAADILKPDDFYHAAHRTIFQTMIELDEEGQPIDLVTLTAALQDKQRLADIGGVDYLSQLLSIVPTAANVEFYARTVKEHSVHRRAAYAVRSLANSPAGSGSEFVAKVQEIAASLGDEITPKKDFVPIGSALVETYESIEHQFHNRDGRGITGIESGYTDLDRMTAGFQKGDLIIVAARPSMGKTAFALNIAQHVGKTDTVAVFSLEMSTRQLIQRMICAEVSLDSARLRTGNLFDDDWEKLTMAVTALSEREIHIDDSAAISTSEIRAKCRRLQKERGLGLVIIDYLQLIKGNRRRNENRQQEVSEITRNLKQIAGELNVPIIALSQLSRAVEQRQDKRPMLSDLRESGEIEQTADVVAFLYREDYYQQDTDRKNIVEIIIAKQRNGPVGTVELVFLKNFNKFVSLDRGHGEQPARREGPDRRRQWA